VRARIHRGTQEIGGSCIELEAACGSRIVLDLGRPLWAGWDDEVPLPPVPGLATPDPSMLGIVISHPHLDHIGLLGQVHPAVPVWLGVEAASILTSARFFSPLVPTLPATRPLVDGVPVEVGPFLITPRLIDHSAFDAYSLVIDADGQRLLYTGDLRAHGRKASLFERLVEHPPAGVDVLLMEGTHVRPDPAHDAAVFETEAQLEDRFVDLAHGTKGAVVVAGSAQNLDRLVTVYRAAKRSGRQLVVDLYGATVAASTRATIPQPGFEGLRVYVPNRQRIRVKESGEFDRVAWIQGCRVFPDELAEHSERFLFHVPSSTFGELVRCGALTSDGAAVWSLWEGYLRQPSGAGLLKLLARSGITLEHIHTSGHASVTDLKRLVNAVAPTKVVPIHSVAGDRFSSLFPRVERHADCEWWQAA
jgi:ribonuclease J